MISCGFDGYVVSTLTAGLAPISSLMELLTQVRCFSKVAPSSVALMESSDVSKYGWVDPNLKLCRPQLLASVYLKV